MALLLKSPQAKVVYVSARTKLLPPVSEASADGGSSDDRPIVEVWFEPADPRNFAVVFRRMFLVLTVVVLLVGLASVVSINRRIADNERFEDRQLASNLAAVDDDVRASLAAAAGREAMLLTDETSRVIVAEVLPDAETKVWLEAVAARARRTTNSQFESIAPDGRTWWHSAAPLEDGRILVIQRPQARAMATAAVLNRWAVVLGGLLVAGLALVWWLLRRRVEDTTDALLEGAEDLRLLGSMRPTVKQRLADVPARPLEFKRLATSLDEIERDVRRGFGRLDSLLHASAALGSSLDLDDVLANTLEQLERVLGAPRAAILQLDRTRGSYTVLATRGHGPEYHEEMRGLALETEAPSARAIRERRPVQVSDTESEFVIPSLRQRARDHGYRSILAVPFPPMSEQAIVLILHKPEPNTYSYDEIELSMSFASIAAAAVRNAELFSRIDEDLSQQTSRLAAIVESVDDGLLVESMSGDILYANATMCSLLHDGDVFSEAMTSSCFVGSVLASAPDPSAASERLSAVRSDVDDWTEVVLDSGGGERTLRVRKFSVIDGQTRAIGKGQIWTDVTRARSLDRMKAGLLATVSHEFRTPLALIKGYATTLLADDVEWTETDRVEFLGLVSTEADRLTGLVDRLLDMRRIDAGMLDLQLLEVELDALVEAALAGLPHLRQRIRIDELPIISIPVDVSRVVTALRNIIENACTYSADNTIVVVGADLTNEAAVLWVRDRGVGVPDVLKLRVFDTFVRGEDGLNAEHGGIGLGLSIARGFIEAHGGRLWAEDGEDGVGTVFRMRIPLSPSVDASTDSDWAVLL